jgi:sRNA-binding regulator protein Hfq
MEKKCPDGNWEYGVSCIEYTEFDKFGITNGSLPKRYMIFLHMISIFHPSRGM